VSISEASRYWPLPVRSRESSAKPTAIAAATPVEMSPIAIEGTIGARSGSPSWSVTPASAEPM
jgi:hypothetical protein